MKKGAKKQDVRQDKKKRWKTERNLKMQERGEKMLERKEEVQQKSKKNIPFRV